MLIMPVHAMITVKQKILKYLIENQERTFSINEISKALKIDYKLTHANINKLLKEESINVGEFGNTRRCSFAGVLNDDVYIVEKERRKSFQMRWPILYEQLEKINRQFIILVFGSQVKGTATKHSDIDLLLISNEEESKKVSQELDLLPYKIHLTHATYDGFIKMLRSKEFTFISEAIKKNIILFGVEDYYRLQSNAK